MSIFKQGFVFVALWGLVCSPAATGGTYTVSHLSGGSWNTVYTQGFSTSLGATPGPGASIGDTVTLSKFEFFKSGNSDSAANIRLAILNNIFPGSPTVNNTTSTSPTLVGLSTNTIASTGGIATGDPISFDFSNLALSYGSDYAAVFVTEGVDVGSGVPLTPVLVSALTANYVDVNPDPIVNDFRPATNYGTESEFQYGTSNFISGGGFFNIFSSAGDANFRATLNAVPEPASLLLGMCGLVLVAALRRQN